MIVLGSGNLGLIYLMEEPRRLTRRRSMSVIHDLLAALRSHPHIGFLLVRSAHTGRWSLARTGRATWPTTGSRARTRWPRSPPTRPRT